MTAKTVTIGEWLQAYPGRGRNCMPSPLNAKKPIPDQWQNLSLTDTDLPESFNLKNILVTCPKCDAEVDVEEDEAVVS